MVRSLLTGIAGVVFAVTAQAAVIEFYNPDLNNYFITADPVEQAMVDTGAVGRWQRTGNAFATGGTNQVCRFYGNGNVNPATGTFYGPNSHFYTANPVECDGLKAQFTPSAKSWKFESNDFATTPALNGACAAGLVPVYRAYNNGFARSIDSNHRITSNYTAYLQTVAAGAIGEGVVMCAPAGPPPIATAVGVATGSATSATIGAAGGSVSVPDGKLVLTIPAGALAAATAISIQPFTNTAPGKSGAAYRLTPDGQTFLKPVTLTFKYTDQDLLGTAVDFLGAAFQTAAGYWQWIGDPTVDPVAKTMSVALDHFTVIAQVAEYQITPASKTVKTKGTVGLTVRKCYGESLLSGLNGQAPTGSDCGSNTATQNDPTVSVNEWSVNTRLGGGDVFGRVAGSGATATYTAPTTVPIPNPVFVSARVHAPRSARGERNSLVVSIITIAEDSWKGTAVVTGIPQLVTAEVIWVLEGQPVNNVATYRPTGTASINQWASPCIIDPTVGPLEPSLNGQLVVDYNASPPTYHGGGATHWAATVTCPTTPPVTSPTVIIALFFGGSNGAGNEARGVVSPDGVTIEGRDTVGPATLNWKFTREQ
jgi:hypothetical protein